MEQNEKISNLQDICRETWKGFQVYIGAFNVLLKKKNYYIEINIKNLYKDF